MLFFQPDITAPGVSVIAAYTEAQGPTNEVFDTRRVLFNSVSGTSMSCPHVSGIVGLLKTIYPSWSPAAIRSAIMTTGENRLETCNFIHRHCLVFIDLFCGLCRPQKNHRSSFPYSSCLCAIILLPNCE